MAIDKSTTHVFGPIFHVTCPHGNMRLIQRCCICGEKLYDTGDDSAVLKRTDAAQTGWSPGDFIRVFHERDPDGPDPDMEIFRSTELPSDSCLALVEGGN
jgi:hypothetical protein